MPDFSLSSGPLLSQEQLDHLPVAMVVLQGASPQVARLERLNRRAIWLLALDPQHLPLDEGAFYGLLHGDDRPRFCQDWSEAQCRGTSLRWEGRLRTPAAGTWLRLEAKPVAPDLWQVVLMDLSSPAEAKPSLSHHLGEVRQLLDSVPIALAIAQLDGDDPEITYINKQFRRSFGYRHDQIRRLSDWKRLAYPDPRYCQLVFEQWDRAVEQARQQQGSVEWMEFRVTTADGTMRDVLFSAWVLGDQLVVTLLDVTERRLVESQLNIAREELARTALELTEAIPVGTYTMVLRPGSPLASFSFLSERFLQLTGLDRDEALADPLKAFACVHPDDYDAWLSLNAEVFEKKLPFFGQTRVIVDGEVRWITAESVPRDLADGSTVWEGVLIDVTERIQAQQDLERSQAHLERILNNLPVAIAINSLEETDPQISFLNDHFIRSLGYSLADIPRLSDWMRLAYPDLPYRQEVIHDWNAAMGRALRERGSVEQTEYRVRSKDGRDLQMLISAVVLHDMVLIALIDVTRSRQAEQRLLQALERERASEEQLRKEIEAKLQVSLAASAVAHEISQPLSAILLNSKLALRNLDRQHPDPDGLRTFLEPLVGEAERMDLITDRIRMLLRHVETKLERLNLSDVVTSALLQMDLPLRESGVELCNGVTSQPWLVMGDAVQLQMALVNLLCNGLEALEDAQISQPRMALTIRQEGNGCIALVLADNGPGFPEGFDPQIPLSSTKSTGTGIGLYVVRLTMENHGGSLAIGRSAALGGAEVVLRLPQADPVETAP